MKKAKKIAIIVFSIVAVLLIVDIVFRVKHISLDDVLFYSYAEKQAYNDTTEQRILCMVTDSLSTIPPKFSYLTQVGHLSDYETPQTAHRRPKNLPIAETSLIAVDQRENKIAALYLQEEAQFSDTLIWLAISMDDGLSYRYFNTGLTNNHCYAFSSSSKLPLFLNDTVLQVVVNIVELDTDIEFCGKWYEYKTVDSNVVLHLNCNEIALDSDSDGLTNIIEQRMLLNSNNRDTDNDGVPDNVDTNPRFASAITSDNELYNTLLNMHEVGASLNSYGSLVPLSNTTKAIASKQIETTYLIITDNEAITQILPLKNRYIVMTYHEYEQYKKQFPSSYHHYSLNIYECTFAFNSYKVGISNEISGDVYVFSKTKGKYLYERILSWIS